MYCIVRVNIIFFNIFLKRRNLWHKTCLEFSCQPFENSDYFEQFLNLIPKNLDPALKYSPVDFTRNRDLPFSKTVVCTMSITASGSNQGVDIKNGTFFKNARRSGLWQDANAVHKSSVTKARNKIPFQAFEQIFYDSVCLANELWPKNDDKYLWHGMPVFALDGSKYKLPATDEIRLKFDPESGLGNPGKGHFPQCLVSTVYDVFRRLPIARTVVPINGSEREQLKKLLPRFPKKGIGMFDRGYPSYDTINLLQLNYSGYYLFRCPASCTFPAVESFIKSGKTEDVIYIKPSKKARGKLIVSHERMLKALKIRVIKLVSPNGEVSVLLTNLFNKKNYPSREIIALYFKRWRVEEYYRDEKIIFEIERFHSTRANGILQELYAAMIISVISRCLMMLSKQFFLSEHQECQFKNAALSLAAEAAFLVPDNPGTALEIFKELLQEIARVKYYRPKAPRIAQPRVNKSPSNKWKDAKMKRCTGNA